MVGNSSFFKHSHRIAYYLLQTVLASEGCAIRDADNNAAPPTVTQSRDAWGLLLAAVHCTPHVPHDCLTAQNRHSGRRSLSA